MSLPLMIFAAGKGTRMHSDRPKVLQTLLGETMLGCVARDPRARISDGRELLNAVRRASSDAPDGIGISVLCSGVTDAAQIENLLSPEYSRYEVIVVLDARRHAAECLLFLRREVEPLERGPASDRHGPITFPFPMVVQAI